MTDLSVTMGPPEELSAPTDDDMRLIDSIKNAPVQEEEIMDVEDPAEELEVKQIVDEKVIFSEEVAPDPPSPPSKKKKPPSDKQRAHLKKAREKALATRRLKAAARKEQEDIKKAEREKKRLEREQKQIQKEESDFAKQKKLQEAAPAPPSQHSDALPSSMKHLSEADIIKLQQMAIEDYEVKRKARKQKKKEAEAKANHDKKVYQSISKAVGQSQDDIWGSCFN